MILAYTSNQWRDFQVAARAFARQHWPKASITFCNIDRVKPASLQTKGVKAVLLAVPHDDIERAYRSLGIEVIVFDKPQNNKQKGKVDIVKHIGGPLLREVLALPLAQFGNICKCIQDISFAKALHRMAEQQGLELQRALLLMRLKELAQLEGAGQ